MSNLADLNYKYKQYINQVILTFQLCFEQILPCIVFSTPASFEDLAGVLVDRIELLKPRGLLWLMKECAFSCCCVSPDSGPLSLKSEPIETDLPSVPLVDALDCESVVSFKPND